MSRHVFFLHRFPRSITNWIRFGVFLQVTVERVFQLADVQLWNPIDHFLWSNRDRVSKRSLVVVEETNIVFHTTPLHFSIFQLLKYDGLEVFLEEYGIRSCLIERKSFFDSKINIDPKYRVFGASSMHCASIARSL